MENFKSAAEIKVGVIGYGGAFNMSRQHLTEMQSAGMTPIAVAEVDSTRLAAATVDFPGIEIYPSVDELLEKSAVDLIVLVTPHNTHAPIALQCLKAGRHVVSEKPLAITTEDVDAMMAAANKSGVMLSTYHNRHWDGRIRQAVDLVRNQKLIGDVVCISCHMGGYGQPHDWWRSSRSISGGILYDWGVHLLEYSLQLIDAPISEVSGFKSEGFWGHQTKWKDDANEDKGFAVVRFGADQWLTLSISQLESKSKGSWVEITGTKGAVEFDGDHTKIYQQSEGKLTTIQLPNPSDQSHCYYENVRDYLLGKTPLVITPEWSRRPIHILDLAAQSAKIGKALSAKYQ